MLNITTSVHPMIIQQPLSSYVLFSQSLKMRDVKSKLNINNQNGGPSGAL